MTHGDYAHQAFFGRVLVEGNVSVLPLGDDEFPQGGTAFGDPPDLRMIIEDQDGIADLREVLERDRGIALRVELEDMLEVGERFLREDDHAIRRGFGRTDVLPCARASRYSNTSAAATPRPDFFIRASRRSASA